MSPRNSAVDLSRRGSDGAYTAGRSNINAESKLVMKKLLASLLVLTASGCPDIKVDQNEVGAGPTVEFDPARSLATGARFIPFPNDLARDPATGKLNLGEPKCPETPTAMATRLNVLNKLDGFGTYQLAMQVTFTEAVDPASIVTTGADANVVMYQVTNMGTALDPSTAMPVPIIVRSVGTTLRQLPEDCAAPETVNAVVFVPTIPLTQKSTYIVALKKGIANTEGAPFAGAYTWGLVSAKDSPVTVDDAGNVVADRTPLDPLDPEDRASLLALNQLWQGHKNVLAYLDATPQGPATRGDLLVAFAFTTQTTTDQLDQSVATSPAGKLSSTGFLVAPATATGKFGAFGTAVCPANGETNPTQCFLKLALGSCAPATTGCGSPTAGNAFFAAGATACGGLYDCAQIGDVLGGAIETVNYQTQVPNTLTAVTGVTVKPKQGPWSDPVNPMGQGSLALETIMTIPTGTAPTGGWPVVIFGHGFGSKKETVLTIAGKLSRAGFATVAVDFAQSGSRAVRTSTSPTLGCRGHCFTAGGTDTAVECEIGPASLGGQCLAGETCGSLTAMPGFVPPAPDTHPQCYDSIFSADLAQSRDNFRQTVLDLQRVAKAVASCGTTNCGTFQIDATRIFYGGLSLGSIIGTTAVAMSPQVKAAALNVGGIGWLDTLENTATLEIRCPLVNSLIDGGVLTGTKWAGGTTTGLCVEGMGNAWKAQPGYATFSAIARWVLDPSDPANFAARLRTKPHLIQEVIGDTVVPNLVQERQAGVTGAIANTSAADPLTSVLVESASVSTNPTQSKLVKYTTDADHFYVHSSLLKPYSTASASVNALLRMQIDFVQYLDNHDDDSL